MTQSNYGLINNECRSREGRESNAFGYVCLSGRITRKLLPRFTLCFYTISIVPMGQYYDDTDRDEDLDSRIY